MKRFTRKTNAQSKRVERHVQQLALYFVWYNFCRPHQSLGGKRERVTPAMAAGLFGDVLKMETIASLV